MRVNLELCCVKTHEVNKMVRDLRIRRVVNSTFTFVILRYLQQVLFLIVGYWKKEIFIILYCKNRIKKQKENYMFINYFNTMKCIICDKLTLPLYILLNGVYIFHINTLKLKLQILLISHIY